MDLPWPQIFLSSIAGSFCLVRFAPQYALWDSYLATFLIFFLIGSLGGAVWKVFLWPKAFSPIRHLPQPKVCQFTYKDVRCTERIVRAVRFIMGSSKE